MPDWGDVKEYAKTAYEQAAVKQVIRAMGLLKGTIQSKSLSELSDELNLPCQLGTLYVKTDEGFGDKIFKDPRVLLKIFIESMLESMLSKY